MFCSSSNSSVYINTNRRKVERRKVSLAAILLHMHLLNIRLQTTGIITSQFMLQLSEAHITSTLGSQVSGPQLHTSQDANNCRLALGNLSPEKHSLGFTREDMHPTWMTNANSEEGGAEGKKHPVVIYLCSKCCCLPGEADTLLDATHHLGASERCCSFTDISTPGFCSQPVM